MPEYRNDSDTYKHFNGWILRPGETRRFPFFVPAEIGLTKVSDDPQVSPTCLSAGETEIAQDETIELPIPMCTVFTASVAVLSGKISIQQNYADAPVALPLSQGLEYLLTRERVYVEKLVLTGIDGSSSIVWDIEAVS